MDKGAQHIEGEGLVLRSTGAHYIIKGENGERYRCIVRGKFRIKGLQSTNPVAVGDQVKFNVLPNEELGTITDILPRRNYILRKAISHKRKVHILAANLDQAILVFTLSRPNTSLGFADRFLLTAEAYHIPIKIVINKIDLVKSEEDRARLEEVRAIYTSAGYSITEVNALDESYKESVSQLLAGKVSFFGGHSGSGKSTLINLIDPSLDLKTTEISDYNQKGKHTTTYAEMHPLVSSGYIIDSPGIKELGLVDFGVQELSHFFPEMRERLMDCKFNDCLHQNEPGCAIKEAVEKEEIFSSRYQSYIRILRDLKSENAF